MNFKKILENYLIVFVTSTSLTMILTFYRAFFGGGKTLVSINHYGEAWLEFIIITLSLAAMLSYTFFGVVKNVKR